MNRHTGKRFRVLRHIDVPQASRLPKKQNGFTLIEVLVAVTLTLMMMAAVVQIFAIVGKSINNSRSTLEMSEEVRAATNRLRLDLEGVTADMAPPARPEEGKGYFEYIEGPIGAVDPVTLPPGTNTDEGGVPDSTVGDRDDILQFTTRSSGEPFVGRCLVISDPGTGEESFGSFDRYTKVLKSQVAEVSWFLRGTTLYRRVLLVSPAFDADIRTTVSSPPCEAEVPNKLIYILLYGSVHGQDAKKLIGYYNNYDLSVHWDQNAIRVDGNPGKVACNTLADLTRRECRYAHPPLTPAGGDAFPYALHNYNTAWRKLGLPTLQETSHAAWPFPVNGLMPMDTAGVLAVVISNGTFDAWANPLPYNELDPDTGSISSLASPPKNPVPPGGASLDTFMPPLADAPRYLGPRVAEDVILTNVLSFDVKAWDPRAPVLQAIDDNNTPANLSDDSAITDVAVIPGDAGYNLPLQHLINNIAPNPLLSHGAYVDLGYVSATSNLSNFSAVDQYSQDRITLGADNFATVHRIYDTWSTHYEHDGINQDEVEENLDPNDNELLLTDEGSNGFDDNGDGVVDDPDEREAPPPYDVPLRGIQVKIRVFDPDSQKVREVTVRHDFLKK